jgi:AraC-like DNA-binding protein
MQNVYNDLMQDMRYNKFVVGDLLFVEYTCPITADVWSVWTQTDFIIHVLRGKKRLFTGSQEWMISAGDTVYVKKGSFCMNQYFDDEFCMLGFFINDDFIRSTINDLHGKQPLNANARFEDFSIKRIKPDPILDGFFSSMYPFFKSELKPSNSLLELKLKELIVNILTTDINLELSSYFQSLMLTDKPSIRSIMENNFYHNLSIEEFAGLTHRSLSAFKRDFKESYSAPPGKWLLGKRLEYSLTLLQNEASSISDVAYDSGFESASHYSRSFKSRYGESPAYYRNNKL